MSESYQKPESKKQPGHIFHELFDEDCISQADCHALCDIVDPFFETASRPTTGQSPDEKEDYWKTLSEEWDFRKNLNRGARVPFNAANLCPEPRALVLAANALRLFYNRDVSQQFRTHERYRLGIEATRRIIGRGLGLEGEHVQHLVLPRNTSEGNNLISNGFRDWKDGSNMVLWQQNHPTNNEAWDLRANWPSVGDRFKVRGVLLSGEMDEEAIAAAFLEKVDEQTHFLSFTQISNLNGMRIPDGAIARIRQTLDRKYPACHLHIDGAMSWGAVPLNLNPKTALCHSTTASAHKWFLGPKETGFLYMHPDRVPHFMPQSFGYDYKIHVPEDWRNMPQTASARFELLGQRDDVNLIHMASAQQMWEYIGFDRAMKRIEELSNLLYARLIHGGWSLTENLRPENRHAILRFNAPRNKRSQSLNAYLFQQGFSTSGGEVGGVESIRLCPTIYNLKEDVARVVEAMNRWRGQ